MVESLNKELRYGTPLHSKILRAVVDRKTYSADKLADHRTRWEKADETMVAYLPKSDADKMRESRREGKGVLDYVTLEVPYAYATIASMHTYISSVFLSRTPVYQMSARHGEGQNSVLALEAALDYQLRVGSHLVPLYNWLWDSCKYGIGIVGEYWDEETKRMSRIVEKERKFLGIGTGKYDKVKEIYEIPGYQGNRLYNIRPFDWFPDPRVPVNDFQSGEFCGRQVPVGMSQLKEGAYQGRYFNIDVLERTGGKKDALESYSPPAPGEGEIFPSSPAIDAPYGRGSYWAEPVGQNFVNVLEMVIRVIPRDWGLGERTECEKWIFTIANETLVIGARPLALYHDKFPYSLLETGLGSEEFIKANTLDHIRPLTQTLTWLFNTHMWNVRKAINDVRVVDPSKIVMKDLEKPQPGGVIRLKPQYFGGDVRTAVMQLQAQDVTLNHLRDSQVVEMLIQRVSGVTDNIMGMMSEGGRKTATEVRTSSGFSLNRMKTIAEYFSALGFAPLTQRLVSNTQQLMTAARKYAVAGGMANEAQRFMDVNPEVIAGFYDFVPVDGTLPIDRLAQANFWKELLVQLSRAPQLMGGWDFGAMLAHTMALQGERNVDRFKIQVAPPGAAPGATLPGNVVPIGGPNGQSANPSPATGAGGATPLVG